jgi:sugar phosphate isomerase/epimerase
MPEIGLQLYTLRAQLAEEYEQVVRRVGDIGYTGVEMAGMYGQSPEHAAQLIRDVGMQITSMHAPLPLLEHITQAIDIANTLGVTRVVCAWYPPENFASTDAIHATCDQLNTANQILRGNSLELHYHNHWQECARVDDKFAYQYMLEYLEPTVGFEVDVYWAKTAGVDPAQMLREVGKRAPLLHIKDGPATMDGDMTAVGAGVVDMERVEAASKGTAEWWIVELDRCATDMMKAVEESYHYLTQRGLAHGRK